MNMDKQYEGTKWVLRVYDEPASWEPFLNYDDYKIEVKVSKDGGSLIVEQEQSDFCSYAVAEIPLNAITELLVEHDKWSLTRKPE